MLTQAERRFTQKPQDVTWKGYHKKDVTLRDGLWLPIKFSLERQRPCESPKLLVSRVPFACQSSRNKERRSTGSVAIMRRSCYFLLDCVGGPELVQYVVVLRVDLRQGCLSTVEFCSKKPQIKPQANLGLCTNSELHAHCRIDGAFSCITSSLDFAKSIKPSSNSHAQSKLSILVFANRSWAW